MNFFLNRPSHNSCETSSKIQSFATASCILEVTVCNSVYYIFLSDKPYKFSSLLLELVAK